jgi:hypothetical protein
MEVLIRNDYAKARAQRGREGSVMPQPGMRAPCVGAPRNDAPNIKVVLIANDKHSWTRKRAARLQDAQEPAFRPELFQSAS